MRALGSEEEEEGEWDKGGAPRKELCGCGDPGLVLERCSVRVPYTGQEVDMKDAQSFMDAP